MNEENLKRFQEDLEQLTTDIALGKLIRAELFGGPLDGAFRLIRADNGTPVLTTAYFVIPNEIKIGIPVDHAKYEWSVDRGAFVSADKTSLRFFEVS